MREWPEKTLGDLVTLQRGIDLPATKRAEGQVPVMGSFGVTGYHDKAAMRGPGVTVGRSGASIGVVSYIECDYWPLNTCLYVKDFHGNNPRFAYYLLSTLDLAHYNSGSAQPSLNRNYIHPIPLAFPSRDEQDQIVELLGALDDKIKLNRQMNETLEAMARAIFKDWFVDFGPTRAKAEGRSPYLTSEIWDLFPDAFDDEDKPVGWSSSAFGELLELTIGGDWGKEEYDEKHTENVAIIRGTDLPTIQSGFAEKVPSRFVQASKLRKRKLQPGDIVIEVSGGSPTQPTGRSVFVLPSILERFETPVVPTSFCRLFRPKNKLISPLLACHLDNLYRQGGTWEYQNQSTGISNFQTTYFLETEQVCLPQDGLVQAFYDLVMPMLIRANTNENIALRNLLDALLPKIMSGEICLRDAEEAVEAVA